MVESANLSASQNLLTARNAILVATVIAVVSLFWGCWKMLRPNDSGGRGTDSYGTQAEGYRALYEILGELHVPVTRDVSPPRPGDEEPHTLVMLGPSPGLVLFEPKYVQSLLPWIERGGRLVVAAAKDQNELPPRSSQDMPGESDILKLLGISPAELRLETSVSFTPPSSNSSATSSRRYGSKRSRPPQPPDIWNGWNTEKPAPRDVNVKATGSLANLSSDIGQLSVPGGEFSTLVSDSKASAGAIEIKDGDGKGSLLAAEIRRGKGAIIVLCDAELLSNALIANADNGVLAAHLLAPEAQSIAFDEYYHGLAVRGNALFLLTRPGFAAVTVGILLVIGVVAWRAAMFLGPPLADVARSRRDIQEYVRAMGAFFARGPGHRRFLVREVRDGVLRQLCDELHLPPHTTNAEAIVAALARRNPNRATALQKVLSEVDGRLAEAGEYPKSLFLSSVQRLAGCL